MNELIKKEETIPGFGIAGMVMCPFMSITHPAQCLKHGCELWVELKYEDKTVGRCAKAWNALLSTETRQSIDKLRDTISSLKLKDEAS